MATSAHLTGKQINTVAADLRVKLGKDDVQAGFDAAMVKRNNMYLFTEVTTFWDTDGNIEEGKNLVPPG